MLGGASRSVKVRALPVRERAQDGELRALDGLRDPRHTLTFHQHRWPKTGRNGCKMLEIDEAGASGDDFPLAYGAVLPTILKRTREGGAPTYNLATCPHARRPGHAPIVPFGFRKFGSSMKMGRSLVSSRSRKRL